MGLYNIMTDIALQAAQGNYQAVIVIMAAIITALGSITLVMGVYTFKRFMSVFDSINATVSLHANTLVSMKGSVENIVENTGDLNERFEKHATEVYGAIDELRSNENHLRERVAIVETIVRVERRKSNLN